MDALSAGDHFHKKLDQYVFHVDIVVVSIVPKQFDLVLYVAIDCLQAFSVRSTLHSFLSSKNFRDNLLVSR